MQTFAIGTMLPLLGLIAGTGVIAPEIDDGTIIHLLAKPISRPVIAQTKFLVAASMLALFAAVPTFVAAYLLVNLESGIASGFALGSLHRRHRLRGGVHAAGRADPARGDDRHHLRAGLGGRGGNFVPGARKFSIQQWAQSIADQLSSSAFFTTEITLSFAIPALLIVTIGAVVLGGPAPAQLLPHRRRVDPSRHARPLSRGRTCSDPKPRRRRQA